MLPWIYKIVKLFSRFHIVFILFFLLLYIIILHKGGDTDMPKKFGLSESEYAIMETIWKEDRELVFGEIYKNVSEKGYTWAATTVQNFLDNLIRKGALTYRRQGHQKIYYPSSSKSVFASKWMYKIIQENFDSMDEFVLSFNNLSDQLTNNQKKELQNIWYDE